MGDFFKRWMLGVACLSTLAAPAAAECLATSGLELQRGSYTALAAPPEASQRSRFLYDGSISTGGGLEEALLTATAAVCGEDHAVTQASLETLETHLAAATQSERAVISLHRLELSFANALHGVGASAHRLAHASENLASDELLPIEIRTVARGLAAQAHALAALGRDDAAAFARSMREAETVGAALADAAPLESMDRAGDKAVRGRYLHYGHAARMVRLWTDYAETGQLLEEAYVVETLAQQAGWPLDDMAAAYADMDMANRERLARDAVLFRFGVAQRRLDQAIWFEHSPYLWGKARVQAARRLQIEADRDDLSDAQRRSRSRQAAALRILAERAASGG